MKEAENRNGFTLVETIIAMTIAAFSLTTLLIMQGNLMKEGGRAVASWHALVELKNFFWEQEQQQVKAEDKDVRHEKKTFDATLVYELKKPNDRSALKDIKNFRMVTEDARWSYFGGDYRLDLIGGRLVPEPKKEEEKK